MLTLKNVKYNLVLLLLLIVSGFICIPVHAQDKTKDELLTMVKRADGKEKVELYHKLYKMEVHQHIDTAMHYAVLALETYTPSMGEEVHAKILTDIGMAHYFNTDYIEAAAYLTDARNLLINSKIQNETFAITNNNLALIYKEVALYEKAVELYISNIIFFTEQQDTMRLAMTYNNLGIIYEKLKQHDKAIENYNSALNLNITNDTYLNASVHLNIGIIKDLQGDFDLALNHYHLAYSYYDTLGYMDSKASVHHNISHLYLDKEQLDSAEFYAQSARKKLDEIGIVNFTTYLVIGTVYSKRGDDKIAMKYFLEGLALGENSGNKKDYLALVTTVKDHYQRYGNYQKAFEFAEKEIDLQDEILDEARLKEIERLEIEYEVTLKNKEIEMLNSQILLKEQNLQISKKNSRLKSLWIGIIISVLVMLVIFSFWLYRRNVYRRRLLLEKQRLLEKEKIEQQLIIDNSVLEKEAFLKEKKLDEQNKVHLQEMLDQKNRELVSVSLINSEKKELLKNILDRLDNSMEVKNVLAIKKMIKENISSADNWNDLKLHFESVHPNFFDLLKSRSQKLSQLDLKHCVYIKMRISNKEIAQILNVNPRSIVVAHYRIKKKLRLPEEQSLISFIEELS